jgi:hypothetical protein
MTITALRLVAGAYAAAKRNRARRLRAEATRKARYEAKGWDYKPRTIAPLRVCQFERRAAMFLVGQRGRDADFRADGTLSLWMVGGRKHLPYSVPSALHPLFDAAKEIDSVTVIERDGKLYGRVALTLAVPEPKGIHPVGIDLRETNALVAVDADGRELFITGKDTKVKNKRSSQTIARLQRKLAAKKAEGRTPMRYAAPSNGSHAAAPVARATWPALWPRRCSSGHAPIACWCLRSCACRSRRRARSVASPCADAWRCGNTGPSGVPPRARRRWAVWP